MRLKQWQWVVLAVPIATIVGFLLIAAGWQIHQWGLSWIWAIVILVFVGWRWLLVKWTRPMVEQMEALLEGVGTELEAITEENVSQDIGLAEAALQKIIQESQDDPPLWEDWAIFWQRCQDLVVAIAHIYHPEVKYPLLNIYIPQAYGLIRGTVDDLDQWMQKLSPVLNQVTVGQAYQGYEVYRKLEPSARKFWQAWNWARWILNPLAAAARQASKSYVNEANQQLLVNLNQMLREAALSNLCRQTITLYSGNNIPKASFTSPSPSLPSAKTQTLREILTKAEPPEKVAQKPVNLLLVGRTGAGKSSLINTLFDADRAEVDVLPSTDRINHYVWQTETEEALNLWDTPGYEQVNRPELREQVLDYATQADLLLLVTPALDPALQMDVDFLKDIQEEVENLPAIAIVTQVDRLRPLREWNPPYNWQNGKKPKEISIREALQYRTELLGNFCSLTLPLVTGDIATHRQTWGLNALSLALIDAVNPAKQLRLSRFLKDLDTRAVAAAKIIDHYKLQMTTTQGLTTLLKSPILQFLSTLSTGSPTLAYLLAEQIPVEQLPLVIGKLQMAYDLFSLLSQENTTFDLLALWPLVRSNEASPDRNAWAFGHTLVESWTQNLTLNQRQKRFEFYLSQS